MRKSRFTDEQMVTILREADRDGVAVVAKRHATSGQTIYTWKKRFGAFEGSDVRRLKALEEENARLKKRNPRASCGALVCGRELPMVEARTAALSLAWLITATTCFGPKSPTPRYPQ